MFQVLTCVVGQHDLRLVLVAGLLCAISCAAAFGGHLRSLRARGLTQLVWAGLTGMVAGSGVWATHFTAMLAYEPHTRLGYEIPATLASLLVAVLGMGAGFGLAALAQRRSVITACGALTGLAVVAMHFVGISAVRAEARQIWDFSYVAAAVAIAVLGGAAAFNLRSRLRGAAAWRVPGLVLTLTIVALHFTAMTAMRLIPDPTLVLPAELMDRGALLVATVSLAVLVLSVAGSLNWMERMSQRSTLKTLRHALNAVPSGLAFFDPVGRLQSWNSQFAALMETAGVTLERGLSRRALLDAVTAAGWFDRLEQQPTPDEVQAWNGLSGLEMQLPDGRWLRHEVFRTEEGGGVTKLTDVSAHKETARAMAEARDAAEAANRAKSQFLANISHELRTPLNGVLGVAQVLQDTPLSGHQQQLVGVIRSSGEHLNALLSDLLDLAKVEAGIVELRPEPVDLGVLAQDVHALFAAEAEAKGVGLRLEMGPGAGDWVRCDPVRLRQVLANLVSNAVKFTAAGEAVLAVQREGDAVRFMVRDTGCGFDAARKAQLFGRFELGDDSSTRAHGGAGLGLAICEDYVRLMGGELDAESAPGEGSAFWFRLELPSIAPQVRAEDPAFDPAPEDERRYSVLIVDDNPVNRQVLGMILDAVGLDHAEAENGREGLEAAMTGAFDAVLMDIQMPVMDGFEATRLIREWERAAGRGRMPILIVSANCLQEHVDAGRAAGADAHLSKPVSAPQLVGALEHHAAAAMAA